ncbi:hypothetical protein LX32DRAFT_181831 [Colletotrichum zoysiae]|uniref:Uncharacterized protein n=1 Tax=Colletotrichum zoysiae TaxID=1216348 RepID=A0AAD9M8F9_9PEZI|nr:hypothetical protein LX32DRAFT_181831 [Colletotrichum zoysiae]
MKQLTFIALVLLPVTVVSAVLSTDIVKFQGLASENEKKAAIGGTSEDSAPTFSFSVAAFGTWAVASVLMTIATLMIVKPIGSRGRRRRTNGSVGGGGSGEDDAYARTWAMQAKRWTLCAWNYRHAFDPAEKNGPRANTERPKQEASAAAAPSHVTRAVPRTTSALPEAPMMEEGVSGPIETPPHTNITTWTSVGRWLRAAAQSTIMWRTTKDSSNATTATTPLPRWGIGQDEELDDARGAELGSRGMGR